ncbi:MAG: dihydroorotase [Oscillospiraceae bacterium]|jgi:dihydroorotase|nr:dihydroorotase [Oscillospiraceae bacterium]
MRTLFASAWVYRERRLRQEDLLIDGDRIAAIGSSIPRHSVDSFVDCSDRFLVPGFVDVHVHLRSPGFFYKETVRTGTCAAARGGYTEVAAMPNVNPVPDSIEHLNVSLDLFERDARVRVHAVGSITVGQNGGELSDMEKLAPHVAGFSDDGHGVQSESLMREAMRMARALGKPIMAHCEDNAIRANGRVHGGEFARTRRLPVIPAEAEWRQAERDLRLAKETGCAYHIQHVSSKETVELVRRAKAEGLSVTCETAPHYLALCDDDIQDDGRFLMNPPIRSRKDRESIIEGLADGTIDCIATDHAPHTDGEKSRGLMGSAMGIVGLETAFPVLYTQLVLKGKISMERLLAAMCDAPRALLREPPGFKPGAQADLTILETETPYTIQSKKFASMGRSTPFDGWAVRGRAVLTMVRGETIYSEKIIGE